MNDLPRLAFGGAVIVLAVRSVIPQAAAMRAEPETATTAVTVANPASKPVPMHDVDNLVEQPFGIRVFPPVVVGTSFDVPAGKHLVITDISGFTGSATTTDIAVGVTTAGSPSTRVVPFDTIVQGTAYAGRTVSLVADPGTKVYVMIDDANPSDTGGRNVDIQGYYVGD
jgi:hypothetical protein